MTTAFLVGVWLVIAMVGIASVALFERASRSRARTDRPELAPPRAVWGGGVLHPPSRAATARALSGFARLVRRRTRVVDHRRGLRRLSRGLGCGALLLGLGLLPIAGTWGGAAGPPLLLLDLEGGLIAILLVLLALAVVLLPLVLLARQEVPRVDPASVAPHRLHSCEPTLAAWALSCLQQPLTAILFAAALSLWVASPRADVPGAWAVGVAGLGLDGDATELYWIRVEARLASVFAVGLFVTLFLGAGGLPLVDPVTLVERAEPFLGRGLPEVLVTLLHVGVFAGKLVAVLYLAARVGRMTATGRDDRSLRLATRRLLPVAWANLLLVAAVALWLEGLSGVGA